MIKNICVLTATRAEYGLLAPIIKKLNCEKNIRVQVAVTGAHLSPEFGLTYEEIKNDGIDIDKKILSLLSGDTPEAVSKAMGLILIGFGEYFEEKRPDLLIVLGDRYETLAVCSAAMNARVPIAHLHGGEITEGAIDESIRHAITKMSYLHFTSCEEYRKRVIQLGEHPSRVFNVGAIGVENVLHLPLLPKVVLEEEIGVDLSRPYAIVTFHPVTIEGGQAEDQVKELLKALEAFHEMTYIITQANADAEGMKINRLFNDFATRHSNIYMFKSLGVVRYLSAVKYASVVIGNSSSGIIEVPSFGVPTVNIGDRQKGRMQADSIINCITKKTCIVEAIKKAISDDFRCELKEMDNVYGDGNTSEKIIAVIKEYLSKGYQSVRKSFYNLPVE